MNNGKAHGKRRLISGRLPLPSSVQVYNWVLPRRRQQQQQQEEEQTETNNKKILHHSSSPWTFRPEPSVKLLHKIRLELLVVVVADDDDDDDSPKKAFNKTSQQQQKQQQQQRVLYSRIVSSGTTQPVWRHLNESIVDKNRNNSLTVDEYESMTLRFDLIVDNGGDNGDNSDHHDGCINTVQHIFHLPIHPSKLVRLNGPLPEQLPLNFVVVQFTDNSIRIPAAHHQILVEHYNKNKTRDGRSDDDHNDDDDYLAARFEDTVFRTLDQVTPAASPVRREVGSLLDRTDEESLLDDIRNCMQDNGNPSIEEDLSSLEQQHTDDNNCDALSEEQIALQELIRQEESALHKETNELQQSAQHLKILRDELTLEQNRIQQIRDACSTEQTHGIPAAQFALHAQQIRLVRDLQSIYPITSNGKGGFSIRGLELPADVFAGQLSEEELSAALGYLCHAVHMLSKYLAVQFRYRLLCHNSRSGIQDERAILYPLFLGRSVDREQLGHGIKLLCRNVDCLCQDRGIKVPPKLHVLGKLKRVYDFVIEGY